MASKPPSGPSRSRDIIQRGKYTSNRLGSATFIGLRALDPLLQYQLLARPWGTSLLSTLHISSLPLHGHLPTDYRPSTWASLPKDSAGFVTALDAVSLSSLPLSRLIILAMATGSTVKHILWLVWLSKEEMSVSTATAVGVYNSLVNTAASLLLLSVSTSAALAGPRLAIPGMGGMEISLPMAMGTVLYGVGMAVEIVAEVQRKVFKDKAENKGKICTTGLWAWARHINYGGYTLWRTGYGLAAGGWPAGMAVLAWHAYQFVAASVPLLNDYMVKKYPGQWEKYQRDVKWVLIPGVY